MRDEETRGMVNIDSPPGNAPPPQSNFKLSQCRLSGSNLHLFFCSRDKNGKSEVMVNTRRERESYLNDNSRQICSSSLFGSTRNEKKHVRRLRVWRGAKHESSFLLVFFFYFLSNRSICNFYNHRYYCNIENLTIR